MRFCPWLARFALVLALAGVPGQAHAIGSAGDPLEELNRAIFSFNQVIAAPVRRLSAKVDRAVDPTLIQGLRNFLNNIAEPGVALSYLAEGEIQQTRLALKRLLINSALGRLGFKDVAGTEGLAQKPANLTDVFCHYGVPTGPYLVLPFYGGMTLRELTSQVVTISAGYALFGEIYLGYRIATLSLGTLDRPGAFRQVQFLDNGGPDAYAASRAWQRMQARAVCDRSAGGAGRG
jgi:phospholipid-binding lipoprotein MlaA